MHTTVQNLLEQAFDMGVVRLDLDHQKKKPPLVSFCVFNSRKNLGHIINKRQSMKFELKKGGRRFRGGVELSNMQILRNCINTLFLTSTRN